MCVCFVCSFGDNFSKSSSVTQMFIAQHQANYKILQEKLYCRSPDNNLLRTAQCRTVQYDLKSRTASDTRGAVHSTPHWVAPAHHSALHPLAMLFPTSFGLHSAIDWKKFISKMGNHQITESPLHVNDFLDDDRVQQHETCRQQHCQQRQEDLQ